MKILKDKATDNTANTLKTTRNYLLKSKNFAPKTTQQFLFELWEKECKNEKEKNLGQKNYMAEKPTTKEKKNYRGEKLKERKQKNIRKRTY